MGPVALFDKSFLQSLSIDESVWFDQFYNPNISPLFYVETLADLDKAVCRGRTAEQIVGNLAEKSPQLSGAPNIHHNELLLANLLGQQISMSNRPIVAGGRAVESGGKRGINIEQSPETKAFCRWQDGEYQQIERDFARFWRAHLKAISFAHSEQYAKKLGIDIFQCKNMGDAFKAASEITSNAKKPYDLIEFIIETVGIPADYRREFVRRYQVSGFPPLSQYAPYAAHVIKVEIFFHICISRGFISAERPSNKIDIAYLHYLPFCDVFISGDKLHKSTAAFFIKKNQRFIWGPELKSDLSRLNDLYMKLPGETKERGVNEFANRPPLEGNFLTAELWDMLGSGWREIGSNFTPASKEENDKLLKYLNGFVERV